MINNVPTSIYASDAVVCSILYVYSDERLKRVTGRSDAERDLATLRDIEVTDYSYIDKAAKGAGKQKKVIAQQVEKVYPQAVSRLTDVVPDIYKKATVKDGWVNLATDLKAGERVRLISEKQEAIHEVLEVRHGAFRTAFQPATEAIFVYGREVKDFRTVDYDALSMLNVSATQELTRRLEKLEKRETHLTELEQKAARVSTLEREVADLKKMVAQLAEAGRSSKQTAQVAPNNLPPAADASLPSVSAVALLDRQDGGR